MGYHKQFLGKERGVRPRERGVRNGGHRGMNGLEHQFAAGAVNSRRNLKHPIGLDTLQTWDGCGAGNFRPVING